MLENSWNYPFSFGPDLFLVKVARFGTHLAKRRDEVGGEGCNKTVVFWKACFTVVTVYSEDVWRMLDTLPEHFLFRIFGDRLKLLMISDVPKFQILDTRPVASVIFWSWLWFCRFWCEHLGFTLKVWACLGQAVHADQILFESPRELWCLYYSSTWNFQTEGKQKQKNGSWLKVLIISFLSDLILQAAGSS